MSRQYSLNITQAEREAIESGTIRVIKRPMTIQPLDMWMNSLLYNYPDAKMFDKSGKQRFFIANPRYCLQDNFKGRCDIAPVFPPKAIVFCNYRFLTRRSAKYSKKAVANKNMHHKSRQAATNISTTDLALQVINVMVEKSKGEWHWLYQVKKVDPTKSEQLASVHKKQKNKSTAKVTPSDVPTGENVSGALRDKIKDLLTKYAGANNPDKFNWSYISGFVITLGFSKYIAENCEKLFGEEHNNSYYSLCMWTYYNSEFPNSAMFQLIDEVKSVADSEIPAEVTVMHWFYNKHKLELIGLIPEAYLKISA